MQTHRLRPMPNQALINQQQDELSKQIDNQEHDAQIQPR